MRKAATNLNSVVTYVVVIGFSNTENRLLPGMTANVRVTTDARDDVLRVPNAALRVRIPAADTAAQAAAPRKPPAAPTDVAAGARPSSQTVQAQRGNPGRVYVLGADGKPQLVPVRIGISDGTNSELLAVDGSSTALAEGDAVVTGVLAGSTARARLPF